MQYGGLGGSKAVGASSRAGANARRERGCGFHSRRGGAGAGRVLVDGGLVGSAPADIAAAAPGLHLVRVEFADGPSQEQRILVQAGQISNVIDWPLPRAPRLAAARGIHSA